MTIQPQRLFRQDYRQRTGPFTSKVCSPILRIEDHNSFKMNHSLAEMLKYRLFHTDAKKRTKDDTQSVKVSRSEPDFQRKPSGLNSIEEEVRSSTGSVLSDDDPKVPSQAGRQGSGGRLSNLKKRISSFSDLRFRAASSTSSPSRTTSESNSVHSQIPATAKTNGKTLIQEYNTSDRTASTPQLDLVHNTPVNLSINECTVSFEENHLRVPRKSASEKHLSSGSITRINTASSASSSLFGRQNRRKSLIRSNSDNDQLKRTAAWTTFSGANGSDSDSSITDTAATRRRSRTVGATDYGQSGHHFGMATGKTRIRSDTNLVTQTLHVSGEKPGVYQPSSALRPTRHRTPSRQSVTSRRSSSLVNAFSNLVSMRSPSVSSKSSKSAIGVEDLPKPTEPRENDSPQDYLKSLTGYGKFISIILATHQDDFKFACLLQYVNTEFQFNQVPLDISLRKLLMFLELPKETQQIDRVLCAFSKSYYEQNKQNCIWNNDEEVYSIVFSLLMLHTDAFNANNKTKMTKQDFVKLMHSGSEPIETQTPREILEYFFDNISAKEFSRCSDFTISCFEETENEDTGLKASDEAEFSPKEIIETNRLFPSGGFSTSAFSNACNVSPNKSLPPHSPSLSSLGASSSKKDQLDIYYHITNNTLDSVTLESQINCAPTPQYDLLEPINSKPGTIKYLSVMREAKGGYLRFRRSHVESLVDTAFEAIGSGDEGSDFRYLKIIQMGNLEELVTNRKFSLVGSVNRLVWKPHFGILTTACLFLFNDMDWVEPRLIVDDNTNTSSYVIECPITVQINNSFICNGLFATNNSDLGSSRYDDSVSDPQNGERYGMYVCSASKEFTFSCPNVHDHEKWIDSINVAAALDGCVFEIDAIPDTIITRRECSVSKKLEILQKDTAAKKERQERLYRLISFVRRSIPLNSKIRSAMEDYLIQLERELKWEMYESCRNKVHFKILEDLEYLREEVSEVESCVDQTFVFSEDLVRCTTNVSLDCYSDTNRSSDSASHMIGEVVEFR